MFINCTQHTLTAEQRAAALELGGGVVAELRDLNPSLFAKLKVCLKLAQIASDADVRALAVEAADYFVEEHENDILHLPIGSPAFMWHLAQELAAFDQSAPRVVFSHSRRESVDVPQADGTVRKQAVFTFEKFI